MNPRPTSSLGIGDAPALGAATDAMQDAAEEISVVGGNYEIRVSGLLSDALLTGFDGLSVTTEPVETVLFGPLPDQESLHRLLIKLQSAGLEVVEFRRLPSEHSDEEAPPE